MYECVAQGGNSFALFPIVWIVLSRWFMLSFVTAMILYYVDLDGREYLAYVARSTTISVRRPLEALDLCMADTLCTLRRTSRRNFRVGRRGLSLPWLVVQVCKMEAALTRVYKRISFASYKQAQLGNAKSYAKVRESHTTPSNRH